MLQSRGTGSIPPGPRAGCSWKPPRDLQGEASCLGAPPAPHSAALTCARTPKARDRTGREPVGREAAAWRRWGGSAGQDLPCPSHLSLAVASTRQPASRFNQYGCTGEALAWGFPAQLRGGGHGGLVALAAGPGSAGWSTPLLTLVCGVIGRGLGVPETCRHSATCHGRSCGVGTPRRGQAGARAGSRVGQARPPLWTLCFGPPVTEARAGPAPG